MAMQAGRVEGAAIRRYLEALRLENAPKRKGRRKTPDSIKARIAVIDQLLAEGVEDPLNEVQIRQEKMLLIGELQALEPKAHSDEHKAEFIKAVKPYSQRKGITYGVWRELGVPVVVLREAGMTPSGR